jgi:C-3',4' desaturase CrtD
MAGLSAAALLAQAGQRVQVLEANWLAGGCAGSYPRRGYVFEAGATTLMGLEPHQPLGILYRQLGLQPPVVPLQLPMTVWHGATPIHRYTDREQALHALIQVYGQAEKQRKLWSHLWALDELVWQASGRNLRFPPQALGDYVQLLQQNDPRNLPRLRWAFVSTAQQLHRLGLSAQFRRYVDAQLLITAQSPATGVPLLFAAPALCYTQSPNYYVPGGMWKLAQQLVGYLAHRQGQVQLRQQVVAIAPRQGHWQLHTRGVGGRHQVLQARRILSSLPIWNLPSLLPEAHRGWAAALAASEPHYWAAYTLGLVVEDKLPADLALHHQLILAEPLPHTGSHTLFASLSMRGDLERAPEGQRVIALSTHTRAADWQGLDPATYQARKTELCNAILQALRSTLPGLAEACVVQQTASSPLSWEKWTYRHQGTVGGLPQRMDRSLLAWQGCTTPLPGLYLCGDTVYPGQGIPGVVLGGIIAARRILEETI